MYRARQGELHFLPPAPRDAITRVGTKTIMFGDETLTGELNGLLYEIEDTSWSEATPANRTLPEYRYDTPVSITGNWVPFNTDRWASVMADHMYLADDALYFDHPRGLLTGLIGQKAEELRTTGPARSGDESEVPTKYRLVEIEPDGAMAAVAPAPRRPRGRAPDAMPHEKTQAPCGRVVSILLDKAGLGSLLKEQVYQLRMPKGDAVELIPRQLLVQRQRTAGIRAIDPRVKAVVKREDGPVEDQNRVVKPIGDEIADVAEVKDEAKAEAELQPNAPCESEPSAKRARVLSQLRRSAPRRSRSRRLRDEPIVISDSSDEGAGCAAQLSD